MIRELIARELKAGDKTAKSQGLKQKRKEALKECLFYKYTLTIPRLEEQHSNQNLQSIKRFLL